MCAERLGPNFVGEAYRSLRGWRATYAGSPLEGEVHAAITRAETEPDLRPIVAPLQIELDADDLWELAKQHHGARRKRRLKAVLGQLLAAPYDKTPAASSARQEFPALAKKLAAKR